MTDATSQLMRGTLHVLILKILSGGQKHGYEIASQLDERSGGHFDIEDGTLYQALHRMEERGWLRSEWGKSRQGKRARFYSLTGPGRHRLDTETEGWVRYSEAVVRVLELGTT